MTTRCDENLDAELGDRFKVAAYYRPRQSWLLVISKFHDLIPSVKC